MRTTSTTPTTSERVAANVRAEIARKGITKDALAAALGIGRSTTYRRLDGERWTIEDLDAAASALGVSVSHLLRDTP